MPKLKFYLKGEPQKGKTLPIRISFSYEGNRLFLATGMSADPRQWNGPKNEFKASAEGSEELNLRLEKYRSLINDIYTKAKLKGISVNNNYLKEQFALLKDGDKPREGFHVFYEKFIEESKATKSPATIRSYGPAWNRLKQFEKDTNYQLAFDTINMDFYQRFIAWCYSSANLTTNSVGFTIKVLKTVMNEAFERGLHKNLAYKSKYFKKPEVESDTVYLTEPELQLIIDLDLSENPRLDHVRDLFIIGCYTGLRISDLKKLKRENVQADYIYIRTQKQDSQVVIPINPKVRAILDKYHGTASGLPRIISDQKYSDYLKDLCELAKIEQLVQFSTFYGPRKVTNALPKWKLVSSHTARRSFATNAYLAGVPVISLMKITGHRTEKAFLKYIRVTPEENARKLAEHDFFSN